MKAQAHHAFRRPDDDGAHPVQSFHDPLITGTAEIQELSKTHEIVSRATTGLWHRILTHYLPLYFPEAEGFHRSSRTDWFLAFLEGYPSPHMISAMSREPYCPFFEAGVPRPKDLSLVVAVEAGNRSRR